MYFELQWKSLLLAVNGLIRTPGLSMHQPEWCNYILKGTVTLQYCNSIQCKTLLCEARKEAVTSLLNYRGLL